MSGIDDGDHDAGSRPSSADLPVRSVLRRQLVAILAAAFGLMLDMWCATWRKDLDGIERLDRLMAGSNRLLLVFWHGKYFPLFPLLKGRRATVVVARSFRGEVLSKLAQNFGFEVYAVGRTGARPRADSGSALAVAASIAIAADGPLGPYHRVRPGLIKLAADTRRLVVPISIASTPRIVLGYRWDRRELPWPYARICLRVADPIRIPETGDVGRIAFWVREVENGLKSAGRDAEDNLRG